MITIVRLGCLSRNVKCVHFNTCKKLVEFEIPKLSGIHTQYPEKMEVIDNNPWLNLTKILKMNYPFISNIRVDHDEFFEKNPHFFHSLKNVRQYSRSIFFIVNA